MARLSTPHEMIESLPPTVVDLAEAVSLAIRIEPQLLRRVRLELLPELDASAEADLWFSDLVEVRAYSGIVFEHNISDILRQRLAQRPKFLEAAWRLVERSHLSHSPAILAEERLAYLALAGKQDEMRALLQTLVATLVSPRGQDIAAWVARAYSRLPAQVKSVEEAQMLALGASLRLSNGDFMPRQETLLDHAKDWADWLSPKSFESLSFGITLLEDGVEFGPVGRPKSHRIEIPKTSPPLVELSWHDGAIRRVELLPLRPQGIESIEFGPAVREVQVRTLLGQCYRLSTAHPERVQRLQKVKAPRVSITYDVEVGDQIEMKELPFVVGVLANLQGGPATAMDRPSLRKFLDIDGDNFDQVMAQICPTLRVAVIGSLRDSKQERLIELVFREMNDFAPSAIIRQVPWLRGLLEIREEAVDLLEQAAKAPDSERFAGKLAEYKESRYKLGLNEENLGMAGLSTGDIEEAVEKNIAAIDAELTDELRRILHHPSFQNLEARWRGLAHLVFQTECSERLRIKVLNMSKQELYVDMQDSSVETSSLFRLIYEEQFGVFGGAPFSVLVGDYEFDRSEDDVELLERIGQVAAVAQAPFLAGVSPELFNVSDFRILSQTRDIARVFHAPEYSRWKEFRNSDSSLYVGLTLNHMLLRSPYAEETHSFDEFRFDEGVNGKDTSKYLWGNPAYALAARMTEAFSRYSWCACIRGIEGGGLVEGLPIHRFRTDEGEMDLRGPTEVAITDRREKELADQGFIPLVPCKGKDYAAFFSVQTCHVLKIYDTAEANENASVAVQLPYIMALCRFAQYMIAMMRDKIGSSMSQAQCERYLNQWVSSYVVADDNASAYVKAERPLREARVEVLESETSPGRLRAVAYLRPHFQLDELTISLRIVFALPGSVSS